MIKKNRNTKKSKSLKASSHYSFEVSTLYTFLDNFSDTSKKYNSLKIKVDSNLLVK